MALGFASFAFQAPQLVEAAGTGCVSPGSGGPGTLTGIVNSYYPATASAAAGATQISVGPSIPAASAPIAPGDMLLVIQMQDADIQGNNGPTYGDGATGRGSTAIRSTGLYEYVAATSAVVAGVVTIAGTGAGNGLVNNYDFSTAVTATSGLRTFQVIRVPQYSSATVAAGLTAAAWDGTVHAGGVLAIDVAGALNLNGQTISVKQLGFKGGLGVQQNGGGAPLTGADYAVPSASGAHGYKAEGIAGTPHYLYDPIANAAVNAGADGYPSGVAGVGKDAARGAPGNAGGGGTDAHPSANDQNSGGGGGANGGQGGMGGNSWFSNLPVGGLGGAAFPASAARVVLGGGGGAGTRNNSTALASSGGAGGGIVMFRVGSLAGTATITADGGVGVTPANDGGGGGGAGGSVLVTTTNGTTNGLTITANGGRGTDANPAGTPGTAERHGPGGGGGGGVIITSPGAVTSVVGGAHGITTNGVADAYGSTDGVPGVASTATPAQIPGSSSGAECLPSLNVTKTTSTPVVTNTAGGTSAIYTITVANAASVGAATGVNISDPLPAGFTFASTSSTALNGGASQTAVVNPVLGATNPTFGTFTVPASGSVAITFSVNIASTVGPGTYSNPATATYLDPTRTVAGGTTSSSYPGGGPERVTVLVVDMTITKTHVDPFVRGTTGTYTLTATNSGNTSTTAPVTVTDTLPAGLLPTSASGVGWTCPAPAVQTVTCSRLDALAGGSSYPPITVTATVLQSAPGSVVNVATVAGGGELNTANDTATDPTNIVSLADIVVIKTVDNPTPNQGANVTFTITVFNNGPSDATGVQVTDVVPGGLALVMATPSAGTTYNVGTGLWDIGPLTKGSSATLQIVATVLGTATVTNTASKTHEDQTDPNLANDSSSATLTGQAADIVVTKTVSNPTPNQGTNVTFTVTATNNGPSGATGVLVTDVVPAGLALVTSTPSVGTTYNPVGGLWNIGALASGANATLSIVATVLGTSLVTNTATKTHEDQTDPNLANDSASATVTGLAADIAVTKTVSNLTPNLGSNVTFTVTATNNGPDDATGVQVIDVLPGGLTLVSSGPSAGTVYDPLTGIWNIGTLTNGTSATLSLVVTVTRTTTVTNTATKTAENQTDPVPANDSASASVTGQAADISIMKTVNTTTPAFDQSINYTLIGHNLGPSTATGVQFLDQLPPSLQFVSYTATQGTYDPVTGIWTVGTMTSGSTVTLVLTVKVVQSGAIVNTTATIAGSVIDPNVSNNTSSITVVAGLPGLPNTSGPPAAAAATTPPAPRGLSGMWIAWLAIAAGLGACGLVAFGGRESRIRPSRGRRAFGLAAAMICFLLGPLVTSQVQPEPSSSPTPVAATSTGPVADDNLFVGSPAVQLIGNKVVTVAPPPTAAVEESFHTVTGAITPARLRIPSIGVDARVDGVGLRRDGSMNVPDNLWTTSWLATGPRPGEAGKSVIAGHRGIGTPALFSHLEDVRPGDRVLVSDASGGELAYEITTVSVLDLSGASQVAVFGPTTQHELVVITCFGTYLPTTSTYDHRLVVTARELPPGA